MNGFDLNQQVIAEFRRPTAMVTLLMSVTEDLRVMRQRHWHTRQLG